ncbi:MAG: NAD(P)-dependent alcohol dehydrogenase, partial [Bdellovibrionales bacterium]|nr:NAD(P)-dependent alcohol dehydrogenase [Bdellovibrionales bacterium]
MKSVVISRFGSIENIRILESEKPKPGIGEVLVEVHYSSLNPIDFKIRDGELGFYVGRKFPMGLGFDFCGRVVGVGERVFRFKVGDRVWGISSKKNGGAFAEYICESEDHLVECPQGHEIKDLGATALTGLTAYQALIVQSKIKKDQRVLINGASGGVGHFAVQISKAVGAQVTGTCSPKNFEFVRSLGADNVVDYKDLQSLKNKKWDCVFDCHSSLPVKEIVGSIEKNGNFVSLLPNADVIWGSLRYWFSGPTVRFLILKKNLKD